MANQSDQKKLKLFVRIHSFFHFQLFTYKNIMFMLPVFTINLKTIFLTFSNELENAGNEMGRKSLNLPMKASNRGGETKEIERKLIDSSIDNVLVKLFFQRKYVKISNSIFNFIWSYFALERSYLLFRQLVFVLYRRVSIEAQNTKIIRFSRKTLNSWKPKRTYIS